MNLIERLNKKELSDLLSKCWMTHDGMWFYHCFIEFGIERTNKMNKAAIHSLAAIEIKRFKKALGIQDEKIKSFAEFKHFFTSISEILIPEFMNVGWSFVEENALRWEFNDKTCFAHQGMKLLGATDTYECGPIYRIECWLKDLGIDYEINPTVNRCVSPDEGRCSGIVRMRFDQYQKAEEAT